MLLKAACLYLKYFVIMKSRQKMLKQVFFKDLHSNVRVKNMITFCFCGSHTESPQQKNVKFSAVHLKWVHNQIRRTGWVSETGVEVADKGELRDRAEEAGTASGARDAISSYENWAADGVLVFPILFHDVHCIKPLSQSIPLKCFRNIKLFVQQNGKL